VVVGWQLGYHHSSASACHSPYTPTTLGFCELICNLPDPFFRVDSLAPKLSK